MRRIPILATFVVVAAIATMISLGIWQLHRAQWKEGLLTRYRAAVGAPPVEGVPSGALIDSVAFRRAHVRCKIATPATQLGGHNSHYQSGFRNIAGCRMPDGRSLAVDLGWSGVSERPHLPAIGTDIDILGRLIPDDVQSRRVLGGQPDALALLLVAETPSQGLQASVPPDIEDIPNNHRGYAVQWFLFASVAAIIFLLAVRRRIAVN